MTMTIGHSILILAGVIPMAGAAPLVKTEILKPEVTTWQFKSIPGPSRSDVAQGAVVTCATGNLDAASATPDVLVNGKLPEKSRDLTQAAFLAGAGSLVVDLGKVQTVAAVNTYSWHEYPDDQGARGPQVYTLSGGASEGQWVKIAEVDTRPNKTGEGWEGKHGASVTDSGGKLGDFRFLKFEIRPPASPKQGNVAWPNPLFSEIDVHTAATLAKAGDATPAAPVKVQALNPDMKQLRPATNQGMRLPPRKYSAAPRLKRIT